jgi:hypothetical protein
MFSKQFAAPAADSSKCYCKQAGDPVRFPASELGFDWAGNANDDRANYDPGAIWS